MIHNYFYPLLEKVLASRPGLGFNFDTIEHFYGTKLFLSLQMPMTNELHFFADHLRPNDLLR